ncbi:hypothetical protein WMZ97_16550 [Lentibacillus sp. N15]|uniref:hypothetical protein n=1 Tax=Lentibacillus songyuanensis TaxID=3136161 RepID=UPI0031BAAA27
MNNDILDTPLFDHYATTNKEVSYCLQRNLPLARYIKGEKYSSYRLDTDTVEFGTITLKGKAQIQNVFFNIAKNVQAEDPEIRVLYTIGKRIGKPTVISHVPTDEIECLHQSITAILSNEMERMLHA